MIQRLDQVLRAGFAAVVAVVLLHPGTAVAVDVSCGVAGGDSAGWAVASGGDFDGDGTPDIAVGAPCAFASGQIRAGRVLVFSGLDGSRLFTAKGSKLRQRLGAAVSFIDDLDGDGRDDLVVGSFGWDVLTPGGATLTAAGRVDVYNRSGSVLLSREGLTKLANFGEAVAGLPDVTGDGVADLVVGAGNDKDLGVKKGRAYLLSGADGSVIDTSLGDFEFDGWGGIVASPGDIDGDLVADIMVASNLADVPSGGLGSGSSTLRANSGVVRVLSGQSMADVVVEVAGALEDNLGRSVAAAGPLGFFAGAPSADPAGKTKAGTVELFSWQGQRLRTFTEPAPEATARFGTAVAAPGDLDCDGTGDLVGAAPNATVGAADNAGRVHALSGATGALLWSRAGDLAAEQLGQALAVGSDFDGDGVADVLIGAPGDDPRGRRGAGSVTVVSGADGSEIMRLAGRRGLETRLFVAGWRAGGAAHLRGFNRKGRRRGELRRSAFRRMRSGTLSVAVLDGSTGEPVPGQMKLVLAGGHGADDDTVRVFRAGRRGVPISKFSGIGGGYSGGVNVAAGDVRGDDQQELVVAQADSDDGSVVIKVYRRLAGFPIGRIDWIEESHFPGFTSTDVVNFQLVNADGANIAIGDVVVGSLNEIVLGPAAGAPVVRVIDASGATLAEWLAYASGEISGTLVATGDLDGDGVDEIVTAPASGLPWVKAFHGDGTPFAASEASGELSFFPFPTSFRGGVRLAVADVDLDGKAEILVASGPGMGGLVAAFESDGTAVSGWNDFSPFGPASTRGLAIAATDSFVRH